MVLFILEWVLWTNKNFMIHVSGSSITPIPVIKQFKKFADNGNITSIIWAKLQVTQSNKGETKRNLGKKFLWDWVYVSERKPYLCEPLYFLVVYHIDGLVQERCITPLLTHWSYVFLALTHWYIPRVNAMCIFHVFRPLTWRMLRMTHL